MEITEIEDRITEIINHDNKDQFIYDFLGVYDFPKATITKLRKGTNNLSKKPDEIFLKNRLYFKKVSGNLMQNFVDIKEKVDQLGSKPRYIIVTDFKNILAEDIKTHDTLDIEFKMLPQKFEFFLAWNGVEKADFDKENPADIRAAERFAKLYDVVIKDNPNATRHGLNLFLIRVLFCLFAEDTGIFKKNLFTNKLKTLTKLDGSDVDDFIRKLFEILDIKKEDRPESTPGWLEDFPYVDGDLFIDPHESLKFTGKSRKMVIEAGEKLEWNKVNPDILGSMLQAVASEDSRSHLGMHYTSVPNIMKVIKPLFLDNLWNEFEESKGNYNKLNRLYDRIGKIKFMDPACGSGNFLIVTYKQLRQLEIDILKEQNRILAEKGTGKSMMYLPSVTLDQFYGIEIDDFACDTTRLSLWIAEHQMNIKLNEEVDRAVRPTLPLQHAGAIVCGNALRIDWDEVLPHKKDDEVYLFGNPPYLGGGLSVDQKKDMKLVCGEIKNYKMLDYVACWFVCGSKYIAETKARFAFVATNSITQGTQVKPMSDILKYYNVEAFFAHTSFKWDNSAKNNANVIVVIIGYEYNNIINHQEKEIFFDGYSKKVKKISQYLTETDKDVVVEKRKDPLFFKHQLTVGCRPNDRKNLIFDKTEYMEIVGKNPSAKECFRKYIGGKEYISGDYRYILWLNKTLEKKYKSIPEIRQRLENLKELRKEQKKNIEAYELYSNRNIDEIGWFIPQASSSGRIYIPMGFISEDIVISDPNFVLYKPELWECGLLLSKMNNIWVKNIGGKLKMDYRYSNTLLYNTFPIPEISTKMKLEIEEKVLDVLDVRDEEGGSLAELYGTPLSSKNPKPMNSRLKAIHEELDKIVDRVYRDRPFKDDNERLEILLEMYSKKIGEENG
ncbi:class I SAM-dependent DNA methyltransferase [Ligilactobacillus salivarius]